MTEVNPMLERIAAIERIRKVDFDALQIWDPLSTEPTIPVSVLRYLIPGILFRSAKDPQKIDLALVPSRLDTAHFFVVEHTNTPITDMSVLKDYREAYLTRKINREPALPNSIDPMHWFYRSNLGNGTFSERDTVLLTADVQRVTPDHLHVNYYDHRPDMLGKGVALEFYDRLSNLARKMGCSYITGVNRERNIGFYTDKLHRQLLTSMPMDTQTTIRRNLPGITHYDRVSVSLL